jgi:hypothetical protein
VNAPRCASNLIALFLLRAAFVAAGVASFHAIQHRRWRYRCAQTRNATVSANKSAVEKAAK